MIRAILYIRVMQLLRFIKLIGLLRSIFLLGLISVLLIIFYNFSLIPKSEYISAIVFFLLLLSLNSIRKDKHFLLSNFEKRYLIYFTEYFLLALPLIIFYLFLHTWTGPIYIVASILIIVLLNTFYSLNFRLSFLKFLLSPNTATNKKINIPVPIKNPLAFEWVSGFRRFSPVLLPLYLIFLGFSYKAYVGPIGMIILSVFISSFFQYGESREFIENFASGTNTFLLKKILINLKIALIVLSPIFIISLIFQPEIYYWSIGAILISVFIQLLAILFKYGIFAENCDLSAAGTILFLNVIFIIIPVSWPIPLIMGFRYLQKAKTKLKIYFDD